MTGGGLASVLARQPGLARLPGGQPLEALQVTGGQTLVQLSTTGPVPETHDQAMALGRELAAEMLAKGAAGLMGERAH